MADIDDLVATFDALDERARSEPLLQQYRVPAGGIAALEGIPPGWYLSEAMEHLAVHGGWWPGYWSLQPENLTSAPQNSLGVGLSPEGRRDRQVVWTLAGRVWEKDWFYTPLSQQQTVTAPLFGSSSQALWVSMVFPHEVSMLQAFLVAYDELGIDDSVGGVNPFFVEWITDPPPSSDEPTLRVHQRLVALSAEWTTDHQCWLPDVMPLMGWPESQWSNDVNAAILGVAEDQVGR
jgi:hypothetical protein